MLWTIWSGIVFFSLLAVVLPIIVIPVWLHSEKLKKKAWLQIRYVGKLILFFSGVRVEIKNKHWIEPKGQYVFVPNHRSYLDALVAGAHIPNHVKYLGKIEALRWPIFGFIVKHYNITVKRDDAGSRSLSLEQMDMLAKSGASIGVFPEGTCNTTTHLLKDFHHGAFKIAVPNQMPIVPISVIGTGELMPRNGFLLKPGKVMLYWHEAISTKGCTMDDIPMLIEKVRKVILADLEKHYPNGY